MRGYLRLFDFRIMPQQRVIVDQMGSEVKIGYSPMRIISLVPSQTELLFELGLEKEVVGITRFCELPEVWHKTKTKVGGTKNLAIEVVHTLKPDLIIGNKEENDKEDIELLKKNYPVWMSDVVTVEDALKMIVSIGDICNCKERSEAIADSIKAGFKEIDKKEGRVLYLIWRKPWMGVASRTFIDSRLSMIGLSNVLSENERYPELTAKQLKSLNTDYVFLSSEPYPFKERHLKELNAIIPKAKILFVDGRYFSWYGSRLREAPKYFNSLKY